MFKYYNVAKTVAPKRAKLQQAEADLNETTENVKRTKARLKEVEEKIERLAAEFAAAVERKVQTCHICKPTCSFLCSLGLLAPDGKDVSIISGPRYVSVGTINQRYSRLPEKNSAGSAIVGRACR